MNTKFIFIAVALATSGLIVNAAHQPKNDHLPYVPNAATAVKVAEAIWLPIYGDKILNNKPFVAKLKTADIWTVEGTLKEGTLGGVPYIEIQKSDCKIIKVSHGK